MRGQLIELRLRRESGLSLLETSISLSILAVGILAMFAAQTVSLGEASKGRHSTEAAQVARDQLEQLSRLPWAASAVQPSGTWTAPRVTNMLVDRAGGQTAATEQSFNVSWLVAPGPIPELRRVDVRIQWTEETGSGAMANKTLVMSTLKANS